MRITVSDICAIFLILIWKEFLCFGPYMGTVIICIFYFLSSVDLSANLLCTRSVEDVFCGERCFNHEDVLVLLCLNVVLNTLLSDFS